MNDLAATRNPEIQEEHLHALWDPAPVGVWVHRDLRIVYVNPAGVTTLGGASSADILGRSPMEFVIEADRPVILERQRQATLDGHTPSSEPLTFRRLDGREFPAKETVWPLVLNGVRCVLATFVDLTELTDAEKALRRSEEDRIQIERDRSQLIEALPQLVWSALPDGVPNYYNHRWYEYTGTSPQSMNAGDWNRVVHAEDVDRAVERWQTAVQQGTEYSIEYRLRRADGAYRWFLGRAYPIRDSGGRVMRWFGTCTDIDDQRRAREELQEKEERFRTATRAVSDLIWTNDANGRMRGEQPSWSSFTGQSFEQYQDHGWSTAIHPDDAQPTIDAWNAVVGEKQMFVFEHRVRRHDGVYRLFSVRALPVLREDGSVREWVGVHSDITERRAQVEEIRRLNTELEERVRQRTAELEASNRELEAFSYSVSHDLRAPLRSIDGFSLALEEDVAPLLTDETRAYIVRIRAGVQRMGRLIDSLLQLSRVTRTDIDREQVNLSQIAADAAEQAQRTQPEHSVSVEIQPGLQDHGDGRLLQIVLNNLMANAFKFTSKTPEPAVTFGGAPRNGSLEYFVRDNGAGFDMQYADKLFHAFQRLHGDRDFPGSGIGLATVHRVILRHGGTVRAEGSPGQGATIYFTLQ